MNANVLNKMMSLCDSGYAICTIVYNEDEKPVDFIFLETSDLFHKDFGVKQDKTHTGKDVFSRAKFLVDGPKIFKNILSLIRSKKDGKINVFYKEGDSSYVINLVLDENNTFMMVLKRLNVMDKILFDKNL